MAIAGAGDSASGIDILSMIQVWAPLRVLSRVMIVIMFGVMGLFPISVAVSGFVVENIGVRPFFPVAGGVTLLAIVVALANPAFPNYRARDRFADRPRPSPLR